jgi:anti-sigma regulatory factor (Ser/Thr protein kinase)
LLPARAENVPLVRHALGGLAETLGMDPGRVADLKTVVTEACMNVVVHAYEEGPGPLEVSAWREDECLAIRVRDFGRGVHPRVDVESPSLRLGLPLIAALSERFEFTASPRGGTVVTMRVALSANGAEPPRSAAPAEEDERTTISVPAGALLGPVLSRVISMFAARADFSLDKLSDAVLLSDAVAANDPSAFPDGTASVVVTEEEGGFTARIGAFQAGGGQRMLEALRIEDLGVSLERLADEIRVEVDGEVEYLALRFSRRPAANGP